MRVVEKGKFLIHLAIRSASEKERFSSIRAIADRVFDQCREEKFGL
jgi:hypothetical protein